MKKENIFFLIVLFLIFVSFYAVTSYSSIGFDNDKLFLLKASEIDLFRPLIKDKISQLYLKSDNFLSVFIDLDKDKEIILSQKKTNEAIPIASLSKLMTAVVALDNYDTDSLFKIEKEAFSISEPARDLKEGEVFTLGSILKIMLIESNNSAAETVAGKMGRAEFISLMNRKAKELNMDHTLFINPSGLDEEKDMNLSTAEDLKKLVIEILNKYPLIPSMLSMPETGVWNERGIVHNIKNTNILLGENPVYLWGKTGYTKEANGCIILVLKDYSEPDSDKYVINIITGADDRFKEARNLENWLKQSFIW